MSNPEGSTCKRPRKQRQPAARGGGGAAIFHRGGTAARHLSFWIFSILVGGFVHGMLLHPNPNFRVPRDPAEFLRACNGIYNHAYHKASDIRISSRSAERCHTLHQRFSLIELVCIDKPMHTNLFMYWYVFCLYLKFIVCIENPDIWIHRSIHDEY